MGKIVVILVLFIVGCGVMNNPKNSTTLPKGGEESSENADSIKTELPDSTALSSLRIVKLPINAETINFTEFYSDSIILRDMNASKRFLRNFKKTAKEMLPINEQTTILSLAEEFNDINYTKYNLLFYPITMQEACTLTVNSDDNQTFILKRYNCVDKETYYPLFIKIDKDILRVKLKLFDKNVTVENR